MKKEIRIMKMKFKDQKLKIKNYELFEQVTNNNQSNQDKHEEEENEVTFDDIINKIF